MSWATQVWSGRIARSSAAALVVLALVVAGTGGLAWLARSEPIVMVALVVWMVVASAIAVVDSQEHRVPNPLVAWLSVATCAAVCVDAAGSGSWRQATVSIAAGLGGVLLALVVYVVSHGGIGMGDVKLMFPVVALLSWLGSGEALFTAYLVTACAMAAALLFRRLARRDAGGSMALAPYVVLGVWSASALSLAGI